jgi:hypothetical protein
MYKQMSTDGSGKRSKVQRVIQSYELAGFGSELEHAWTATNPKERESLRDLAMRLNKRILESALHDAGETTLEGEVENTYHLLTNDEVSPGDQKRAKRQLERKGIDAAALVSDFVSYQAIRTYLKDYRDAQPGTAEPDRRESAVETIQRLRSRLIAVAEDRLRGLQSAGRISVGDFRVILDFQIMCEDCGTQKEFTSFIRQGGCNCTSQ